MRKEAASGQGSRGGTGSSIGVQSPPGTGSVGAPPGVTGVVKTRTPFKAPTLCKLRQSSVAVVRRLAGSRPGSPELTSFGCKSLPPQQVGRLVRAAHHFETGPGPSTSNSTLDIRAPIALHGATSQRKARDMDASYVRSHAPATNMSEAKLQLCCLNARLIGPRLAAFHWQRDLYRSYGRQLLPAL